MAAIGKDAFRSELLAKAASVAARPPKLQVRPAVMHRR